MYGKLGHGNEAGCATPKRVEGLAGVAVSMVRLYFTLSYSGDCSAFTHLLTVLLMLV